MKTKVCGIITALCFTLTGCARIAYPEAQPVSLPDGIEEEAAVGSGYMPPEKIADRYKKKKFDYTQKNFLYESQPGEPWIVEEGGIFLVEAELLSSQHYRIGINASALPSERESGAVVTVSSGDEIYGAFYIDAQQESAYYELSGIYLKQGNRQFVFECVKGTASVESAVIADSFSVGRERYKTISATADKSASVSAICTLDYLNSVYGAKTLTGQYCTINTNTELEAVRKATGRYPAIRCGDLADYSRHYGGNKDKNKEIELAGEWGGRGGIVFFTWSWYSPEENGHYYSHETYFSIDRARINEKYALLDIEQLAQMREKGDITLECLELIRDIDEIAEALKELRDKDIPVLWNPLPCAGSRIYWWGAEDEKEYISLWRLMFERMTRLHGLNNLLWVWSGSDYRFYPGDNYVDIIGESVYTRGSYGSEAVRFSLTAGYAASVKPVAVTESGRLPNPDALARDNAYWLFWSLYRGDYIVDDNGMVLDEVKDSLDYMYNHELSVCFDGLPDVKKYGIYG